MISASITDTWALSLAGYFYHSFISEKGKTRRKKEAIVCPASAEVFNLSSSLDFGLSQSVGTLLNYVGDLVSDYSEQVDFPSIFASVFTPNTAPQESQILKTVERRKGGKEHISLIKTRSQMV